MEQTTIGPDTVAWLQIDMFDLKGEEIEKGPAEGIPVLFGHGDIFPALEKALLGKKEGDVVNVTLEPEDAFGESDPELIKAVPLNLLGDNVEEGMRLEGVPNDPTDEHIYTGLGRDENRVYLDGTHPLAGWSLKFIIKVLKVEKATPEEVEEMESSEMMPDFLQVADVTRKDIE